MENLDPAWWARFALPTLHLIDHTVYPAWWARFALPALHLIDHTVYPVWWARFALPTLHLIDRTVFCLLGMLCFAYATGSIKFLIP